MDKKTADENKGAKVFVIGKGATLKNQTCYCKGILGKSFTDNNAIVILKTIPKKQIYWLKDIFLTEKEMLIELINRLDEKENESWNIFFNYLKLKTQMIDKLLTIERI